MYLNRRRTLISRLTQNFTDRFTSLSRIFLQQHFPTNFRAIMLALNTSPLAATVVILSLYWVISSLYKAIRLRHVPGPWPAKFSSLWRVWFVHDGSAHQGYRTLHHQYGPIVRT